MLTAPKGDFGVGAPGAVVIPGRGAGVGLGPNPGEEGSIPYKTVGSLAALKWDPAKDEAEGNQCKAYGAAGIMRLPTHLHITWQDDNTLKIDADFGTQTRLIHFVPPPREGRINFQSGDYVPGEAAKLEPPPGIEPSWQGYSAATWIAMGGRGNFERGGSLKVVTSRLKPSPKHNAQQLARTTMATHGVSFLGVTFPNAFGSIPSLAIASGRRE